MGLLSKGKGNSGHIRVHASGDGRMTSIEVIAPLLAEEVQPALDKALTALAPKTLAARRETLEAHKKAVRKKAGVLDKLRGKAAERLAEAEANLPTELFEGKAGSVTVHVDGELGFVRLDVTAAIGVEEAGRLVPEALDNARGAALAAWERVVVGAAEAQEPEK
jgi:DNA-binding protein YbaB